MSISQIIFIITVIISGIVFFISISKIFKNISLLKKPYSTNNYGERIQMLLKVAFAQTKIFRLPVIGFFHALVFWGFLAILFGSFEMIIDGLTGYERIFSFLGPVYSFMMAIGDISAFVILLLIIVFLFRRWFLKISRFQGVEMRHKDHKDASFALLLILILMVSLLDINIAYVANPELSDENIIGCYPVSSILASLFSGSDFHFLEWFGQVNWWIHILGIFFFANYLPYSKHFHVFMSLPNVYFSRVGPLTQMTNMDSVKNEVKLMMDPNADFAELPAEGEAPIERFGIKDVEDGTWKNYIDSLTCTQCGRCSSVCPANQTGKKLSPRKIVLDFRRRMEEKSPGLRKNGKEYDDGKSLFRDYISFEELWACTTCNACAMECPVNIDHPTLILDIRRYIFMEESAAPSLINAMSTNIENNGAPWQYPPSDRLKWADELYINE